jgi:1-acyl-sn-glycerol-3-phosphate acyltransferase
MTATPQVPSRSLAVARLAGLAILTLPLMPVQAALLRVHTGWARRFPHWYHRTVCRVLGIRLDVTGEIVTGRPVLVISNHVSWLDIPILSAVAPVSFVAKKEIARWPLAGTLARLQRTIFVDRERRTSVGVTADEILTRLSSGDAIVLFAEGTSSDGNRILPFKTSLFAAAKPTATPNCAQPGSLDVLVQPMAIAYTRRSGIPLGWAGRRAIGYIGDVDIGPNAWDILTGGPLAITINIGAPVPLDAYADRKDLARRAEADVRTLFAKSLRG